MKDIINSQSEAFYSKSSLFVLLFLIPYFFLRLAYGDYNEYISFNLAWIQISLGILVIFKNKKLLNSNFIKFHLIFFISIGVHFIVVNEAFNLKLKNAQIYYDFIVVWLYLSLSLVFSFRASSRNTISQILFWFEKLSAFTVLICLGVYILKLTTGISILLNNYGGLGLYRAHGFMTEPSALAAPIGYLAIRGLQRGGQKKNLILAAIGMLITQSAVVFAVVTLAVSIYFFKTFSVLKKIQIGFFVSLFVGFLVRTTNCAIPEESFFSGALFIKTYCGAIAVADMGDNVIYNERLVTFTYVIDALDAHDRQIVGFGLNASQYLMPELYGNVENSLLASLLFFFGYAGAAFFTLMFYLGLRKSFSISNNWFALYLTLAVASMINSAGGFYSYLLFFFIVYVTFLINIRKDLTG